MMKEAAQDGAQGSESSAETSGSTWVSFLLQVVAIALVLASIVVAYAWWRTGALRRVWPYLAGQQLLIEPPQVDLGDIEKGMAFKRELKVVNLGSRPMTLLGAQSTCGCISLDDFPIVVPGGTEAVLGLKVGTTDKVGAFIHRIKLFTDVPGHMSVIVSVEGVAF